MKNPRIRKALISVSDKHGLAELARALAGHDVEILSTGGTARCLREAGIPVREVSDYTGFPEILDGRIKTLHPKIHGGILARPGTDDAEAERHGISEIDLVVVNLYPFAETVMKPDCGHEEAVEQIDIGGPALLRAAAKNHARVTVLCRPGDYPLLLDSLPGAPPEPVRQGLAARAFAYTAAYDGQIGQWLAAAESAGALPGSISLCLERMLELRYGENPHQLGGLYCDHFGGASGLAAATPLMGKPLSYNNLLDADAAWQAVRVLGDDPACVIVKHAIPCGAAVAGDLAEAWRRAHACDPVSAYGGIVAFNRPLDARTAAAILDARFVEVLIAPEVAPEALKALASRPGLRVLAPRSPPHDGLELRRIDGGWLAQTPDPLQGDGETLTVPTRRAPDERETADLRFAWQVVKMVRSNAIVYARDGATLGIGAGQTSRVDAARFGAMKACEAGHELSGAVMASDAFLPFADTIETAAGHGIRAVVQPGGSKRDAEVISACDAHGIAMVFTGRRHFRH